MDELYSMAVENYTNRQCTTGKINAHLIWVKVITGNNIKHIPSYEEACYN